MLPGTGGGVKPNVSPLRLGGRARIEKLHEPRGHWVGNRLGRRGMTDHLPNARQLARREPADRFRQLERHLDAGVEGEVGGTLAEAHPIH